METKFQGAVEMRTNMDNRLLSGKVLAEKLDVSPRQIWRLLSVGKIPSPIHLNGSTRWDAEEIEAWIKARCPSRIVWEAIRGTSGRRAG